MKEQATLFIKPLPTKLLIRYNEGMRRRNPDRIKYLFGLISISMLLLLSGCVSSDYWTWQHPEKQDELQLLKDKKECRDLARSEVSSINYGYNFYGAYDFPYYWPHYRGRHHPTYFRSYTPYFGSYGHYRFLQQQDDLERFFRICMKSKGWYRVKIVPEANQPVQ